LLRSILVLSVLLPGLAGAADEAATVDLTWGVKIPLRDGTKLNATIYRPRTDDPLPVVFTLTPYMSDTYHDRAYYFAQNGYVFALVDVRGRGNSEGAFDPFRQEAKDGHDVVEWLAAQSWSNGKVGMWGGSYAGYDQWATAKEFPEHLTTIVPAAAAFAGIDFPYWRNISYPYIIQWQTLTSGVTPNFQLFGESSLWISKYRELFLEHRPFADLPDVVGNHTTKFAEWLEHPIPDAYWDAMNPSDQDFARFDIPILTITGHYDGDQPGAMEYYRRHMRFGSESARQKHFLIVGPWDHAGTRTPKKSFGGWEFGDASVLDLNQLHREWYDWTMKDGPRPEFLKTRVAYYLAGAEEWRHVESIPMAARRERLYLDSAGSAGDVFRSGTLVEAPRAGSPADEYTYDPLDVRPAELEREVIDDYITDQSYVLSLFGNGLVFHSEPFRKDTELTGYVRAVLSIELDVPDTDFSVTLYEILRDGRSVFLTRDQMRARHRESLREEKLVTLGEIHRYPFDGFYFFSRRIAEGSRLRVVLSSPNSIFAQKNYNGGGVVAQESGTDARTAHVKLHHDEQNPSFIELPVVQ